MRSYDFFLKRGYDDTSQLFNVGPRVMVFGSKLLGQAKKLN
jgi:hypothetical protein